jgi:hypothetical protein
MNIIKLSRKFKLQVLAQQADRIGAAIDQILDRSQDINDDELSEMSIDLLARYGDATQKQQAEELINTLFDEENPKKKKEIVESSPLSLGIKSIKNMIQTKLEQKKQEQKPDAGQKDYEQWQIQQQEAAQKARAAGIIDDRYLQSLNFYTISQFDIQRFIKHISPNLHGKITIKLMVESNFAITYIISNFNGTGLDDAARNIITNGLKRYTRSIINELQTKMQKDNVRLQNPVSAIMFDGNI